MPYGRRLTSLAVVVVHPLALFASTLSSSKRRNENVANERDTCGVRAIHPRPEGRGFPRIPIKAIIALGKTLGMTIVAEGVETSDQQQLLTQLGCNTLQGYLLARPAAPDKLLETITHLSKRAKPTPVTT